MYEKFFTDSSYRSIGSDAGDGRHTLPYSETFDTAADFATMTVVDANSDNKTWYHSDYYKSAMIDYSDDSSMDDWLILPAFSLAPAARIPSRWMPGATANFLGNGAF